MSPDSPQKPTNPAEPAVTGPSVPEGSRKFAVPEPDAGGTVFEEKPALPSGIQRVREHDWIASLKEMPPHNRLIVAGVALFVVCVFVLALYAFWPAPKPIPIAGAAPRALAISRDGSHLLAGLRDGSVRLLEVSPKGVREKARTQLGTPVLAAAFGPDDSALLLVDAGPLDTTAPDRTEPYATLVILSPDLRQRVQRKLQPNAHDVVWSAALRTAIVLSGGSDDLHAGLEYFSADPVGLAASTPQLRELGTYYRPQRLAVANDGDRLAISFASRHRMNVLLYDPRTHRQTNTLLLGGSPEALAFSNDGNLLVSASPDAETIDVIRPKHIDTIQVPKSSSLSPPRQLAIAPDGMRAYSAGALTLAEIQFDTQQVLRKAEPPFHSSSIVLSPDGKTAYLLYSDRDDLGIVDLASGSVHQLPLR